MSIDAIKEDIAIDMDRSLEIWGRILSSGTRVTDLTIEHEHGEHESPGHLPSLGGQQQRASVRGVGGKGPGSCQDAEGGARAPRP